VPGFLFDFVQIFRNILRRPVYPVLSMGILALGLTTGLGVFTYVNGFNQPFPGANPDGLLRIVGSSPEEPYLDVPYLDYVDYAAADLPVTGVAAVQPFYAASVRHEALTEVAFLEAVSGSYFSVLEIEMAIGRALTPDDDVEGAPATAVLSHEWWMRQWNGDPDVLGEILYLNYRPHTIVGVAAPTFNGSSAEFRPNVWIPFAPFRARYVSWDRAALNRDVPLVRVYARVAPGVTATQAAAAIQQVADGLDATYPAPENSRRIRAQAATWVDPRAGQDEAPRNRLMMLVAVGFLVLVCANVANLLLALAEGRRREFALHAAIGASRGRLLARVLMENLLISSAAGVLAVVIALPLGRRLGGYFSRPSIWGEFVPMEFSMDGRVLGVAVALAVLTGLLSGVGPAIRASRSDLRSTLSGGRSRHLPVQLLGWRIPGARDWLVSAQAALSISLLVVAGLMLRSLNSASAIDPGFDYEHLVASHISTSSTGVQPEGRREWFVQVAELIAREPWVKAATITQFAPLSAHANLALEVPGSPEPLATRMTRVHRGFFDVVGIDLEEGRRFEAGDSLGTPRVAVINRETARRLFPGGDALGREIRSPMPDGGEAQVYEVVGISADARAQNFLIEPEPAVYLPFAQYNYPTGSGLVLAVNGDPAAAVPLMERWLRNFEPHLAIVNVLPYTEVARGAVYSQRMNAELFSIVAALGLILSAVGIFAVVGLAVARRGREFGIRLAIGAQPAEVQRQVVREALMPVLAGLVLGLGGAMGLASLLQGLLFGVEPADPTSVLLGAVLLLFSAWLSAYFPARRAGQSDPVDALRAE